MRSEVLSPGIEKDELLVRSTIGQELCSFYACTRAWEDMEVGEGYDLGTLCSLSHFSTCVCSLSFNIRRSVVSYRTLWILH